MLNRSNIDTSNYLIRQLPQATAFINQDLELVHVSDSWEMEFHKKLAISANTIPELDSRLGWHWGQELEPCLNGKSLSGVQHYNHPIYGERWMQWHAKPWFGDDENIVGAIVQVSDATEMQLKQQELDKTQALLNEKASMARIGSWEIDLEANAVKWSVMTKEILEVPEDFEPTIDCGLDFFKHGHSKNTAAMSVYRATQDGTPWKEKLQLTTHEGREIWVLYSGKPVYRKGKITGVIGTLQDIDEQAKHETRIKASENLLKTIIDNLPLKICFKDTQFRNILVNKAECEYMGVKNEKELLGKTDYDFFEHEVAEKSHNEDLMVLGSLRPLLAKETINVKKNGVVTNFLTSKIPLSDEDGNAYGVVTISTDITDLKRNEEKLRSLINVTSLQNKKLINFAHIVSHNLRSHSANFSMLLDFLVQEKDEAEKKNLVQMLIKASNNLLETLDNLNEVVAISSSNAPLKAVPLELKTKAKEVENGLSAFLENHKAAIINLIPEGVMVKAEPNYLESIIKTFITNAVKYRHPDRSPVITLSTHIEGNRRVLSVADNGMGMDLEKHGDKLFGMYKTFHGNSNARGIGLFMAKNQIEAMGGSVTAESQLGKGSVFNIHFNEKI